MSIKDFSEKIKQFGRDRVPHPEVLSNDLFLGLIIILVAIGAFGLGRLSKIEGAKAPIRIENEAAQTASTFSSLPAGKAPSTASQLAPQTGDTFVASKSGTKYYFPWCSGAQKIAPANIITFTSQDQAKAAGYSPSSTCKGL
jgi:hypothetical protein